MTVQARVTAQAIRDEIVLGEQIQVARDRLTSSGFVSEQIGDPAVENALVLRKQVLEKRWWGGVDAHHVVVSLEAEGGRVTAVSVALSLGGPATRQMTLLEAEPTSDNINRAAGACDRVMRWLDRDFTASKPVYFAIIGLGFSGAAKLVQTATGSDLAEGAVSVAFIALTLFGIIPRTLHRHQCDAQRVENARASKRIAPQGGQDKGG